MQLEQLDVKGRRVLVRVDFNLPFNEQGQITDDTRLRAALPTLNYLLEQGASLVVCSHLGRPQKKRLADGSLNLAKFSLRPVAQALGQALNRSVAFCPEAIGAQALSMAQALQAGEVLLLENTRFEAGEEKGSPELAAQYAALADVYVNDAFGAAHRAHASTAIVAQYFAPQAKAFGFLMRSELENAQKLLNQPEKPVLAIVGGAKVSDKILLLDKLVEQVDAVLVGGGMAYTFFLAQGGQVGKSLVEADKVDLAKALLDKAKARGVRFLLPEDSLCSTEFANEQGQVFASDAIPAEYMGLDIGPKASAAFQAEVAKSRTIFWNGPMGVFEFSHFAEGSLAVARALGQATEQGAYTLVGGGDSVAALNQLGMASAVSYVSTGGGAMLELLEGKTLPGVAAMEA